MRAVIHTRYGPPEVAGLQDIPKPTPKQNEILVKVIAATVNRTDAGFRSAVYFVSRFWSGLLRPKQQTLGCEFAGIVESAGKEVRAFKPGDRVFGYNDKTFGAHAEYLVIAEDEAVELIPEHMSFEEAAPLMEGAHYALNNIKASKIQAGQNALVYGATGAIGSAAVQLLKYFGANVTAVSNTRNVAMVQSLGADTVVDYQKQDFTRTERRFHFIFDAVGKSSFKACRPLLTETGVYISTELGKNAENVYLAMLTGPFAKKKVLFPIPSISKEDVRFLKHLAEQKSFKPVIDRTYLLEEIVAAYKYVESGQKTGNVILQVAENIKQTAK